METITEQAFMKLCDDVYRDRHDIYPLNPNVSHREALLWMLLGNLVSLLSIPILEQPSVYGGVNSDPYGTAVIEVVTQRAAAAFDAKLYITTLSEKLETEI
jgi:hypothetical protein